MHPLVPLSLLESMREIDIPLEDTKNELDEEMAVRRLGANRTVANQIARYQAMVRRGSIGDEEALSIIRLCGRRPDAALVFSDAGRRAAQQALHRVPVLTRVALHALPGSLRGRLGWVTARKTARKVFDIALDEERGTATARFLDVSYSTEATPDGTACAFFGSAIAALLRGVTEFDGAVTHDACIGRDDPSCIWHTQLAT